MAKKLTTKQEIESLKKQLRFANGVIKSLQKYNNDITEKLDKVENELWTEIHGEMDYAKGC